MGEEVIRRGGIGERKIGQGEFKRIILGFSPS
jgi:hypothetical protein